jgi:hypothetical protein
MLRSTPHCSPISSIRGLKFSKLSLVCGVSWRFLSGLAELAAPRRVCCRVEDEVLLWRGAQMRPVWSLITDGWGHCDRAS